MKLLLDTNILIWSLAFPDRLRAVRPLIEGAENELVVSAVCAWEIAIKHALGRLGLPQPPALYVPDRLRALGASSLAITQEHVLGVADLPLIHGDPFDRLLVAQALQLGATLVTGDAVLADYPAETLLV